MTRPYKFVHIPKTAGVAICQALGLPVNGHYQFQPQAGVYQFAFVRNPWDRVASAYYYLKAGGRNKADAADGAAYLDGFNNFGEFAAALADNPQPFFQQQHFRPQLYWLRGQPDKLDYLGRYERLAADWAAIQRALGLAPRRLPRVNQTPDKPPYLVVYAHHKAAADAIGAAYRDDCDALGYSRP